MEPIKFGQTEQQAEPQKKPNEYKQWFPKEFLAGAQIRIKGFKMEKEGSPDCHAKFFNKDGYTGRLDFTDVYGVARFMYIHSKVFMDVMSEAKIQPNQIGALFSKKDIMQTPQGSKEFWNWDWKLIEDTGQK